MWIKTADLDDPEAERLLAAGDARALAELAPANPAKAFARALALCELGRGAEAKPEFEKLAKDARLGAAAALELALLDLRAPGGDAAAEKRLDALKDLGPAASARAAHIRGLVQMRRLDHQAAIKALLDAADGYGALGEGRGVAQVNDTLGTVYATLGQIDSSLSAYARSLAEKSVAGDRMGVAITLGNLGRLALQTGRYAEARAYFENDLKLAAQLGDARAEAKLLNDLGRVYLAEGKLDEAAAKLDEAIGAAKARDYRDVLLYALKDRGDLSGQRGDEGNALAAVAEARKLLPAKGADYERLQLDLVEAKARAKSDPDAALKLLDGAIQSLDYIDLPDVEVQARLLAAELYAARGKDADASRTLLLAVKRCRARGLARYMRTLSEAMARYGVEEGIDEEAGRSVSFRPDDALEGYFLREELGSGAFGTVYRAFDLQRGREVALKQLSLDAVYDRATRETFLDSLRLELEAAARVNHPGVAKVYAIGRDKLANPYVVQQLVSGRPLRKLVQDQGTKSLARICQYMALISHGVAALHQQGIVHRDLKPENVIVTDAGSPVLIDFGIAYVANLKLKGFKGGAGTKGYAPPEQATTTAPDPKLDVYTLGVMAWEWWTGSRPEKGLASLPPAKAKRGVLSGLFGGDGEERTPAETDFLELVRAMMAPADKRPSDANAVAKSFEKIAAEAEEEAAKKG